MFHPFFLVENNKEFVRNPLKDDRTIPFFFSSVVDGLEGFNQKYRRELCELMWKHLSNQVRFMLSPIEYWLKIDKSQTACNRRLFGTILLFNTYHLNSIEIRIFFATEKNPSFNSNLSCTVKCIALSCTKTKHANCYVFER